MKKLLSVLFSTPQGGVRGGLLFLLFFASASAIYASDTQVDGIWYDFDSSTKTASVTYRGYDYDSYDGEYSGSVIIPETVNYNGTTYSVTSIGDYAFYGCSSLSSVTIGESVTSIGEEAFYGCSSLTKTNYIGDIAGWCNIMFGSNYANPMYCSHNFYINDLEIKDLVIPNNVTSIGSYAFNGCSSLTSVTIPNSVTSIGASAFYNCSKLTKTNYTGDIAGWCNIKFYSGSANPMYCSHNFYINDQEIKDLVIPNSVTSIGGSAFYGCSSLTSVTIPNSVTSIGDHAFNSCSSLTSMTIPNSVTSIGSSAFKGCSSLTSVTILNSVTSIGEEAFYKCSSLTSVTINSDAIVNKSYSSSSNISNIFGSQVTEYIIGESVTSIGHYAFSSCSGLISVTIPNSVTSIGSYAFNSCSSLTSVTIPNSVTSIGHYAFYGCSSLTSVTIPNSVISIGSSAFYGCSSLTSVTIPNSVTSIGDAAFYVCSSLTSVTINSNAIVSKDYKYNSNISHIFGSQVTEYIIGDDVKGIGSFAFYGCSSLTSVTIGESVTRIGKGAFYNCSSLSSVTIPNSVTSIGGSAFEYCSSLTSVTIGESVTSIGESAFLWSSLTKTNYTGDIAGWCNIRFGNDDANPMCYSHNFYINDQEIKDLVIPNNVTSIGAYAFCYCSSLTSVTIPNSVTSIGYGAFSDCSSLTSITIPESVTSIGSYAFNGCSSLTKTIYIGDIAGWCNIKFEDDFANPISCSHNFYINDQEIKDLVIPNSVTSIGSYAFNGCSSLSSVTIGESVTSIGDYAFYYCSSLTSITCKAATPPTIGNTYTFYDVSTRIPVYVPCGCVEAYNTASGWEYFTNIQLVKYSIEVYVNDTIMGSAKVDWNRACDTQISASPNIGYHFVQWSDGNTDTIRTLVLTQDTILTAEFALTIAGQCGDNLYWSYDEDTKTISITGSGKMYDYTADTQPWLLFKEQIKEVTTTNTVTSIGTSAFEGCARLSKVSLGTGLEEIAANAFAGCTRLYDIYTYATYPPFAEESSFANYNVYVYIPCEYQRDYILDVVWGEFKFIECIDSEEATTDGNVTIVPGFNDVTITWPTETEADSYTIVIKKGDTVFCTLTFNADGQLLNIAFAPGRDGNHPVQYAEQAGNGYRFTVTGLEEGTQYAYNITTKDAANKTIATYSGEFTTMGGTTTDMDNIQSPISDCQKILYEDHIYILRDGKTYTIMGAEVK